MEDVVLAEVVVPIVVSGAFVLDAKLKTTSDNAGDGGVIQVKVEFVGKSVARSDDVFSDDFGGGHPIICRVTDQDSLVEIQVDNPNDSFDGGQVGHVGALHADFLVAKMIEEFGTAARLVEERCDSGSG